MVGSTSRGPVGRLLVGGVGERLLAGAACPVAFAPRGYGERRPPGLKSVAVGFDGSDESRRALDATVAIAAASQARIRVLTAFERMAFGGVATSGTFGESANDVMRSELRARHDAAVAQAAESVPAEGRFRDGDAGKVLEEDSRDVDLLVAGSRSYGPLGAVLIGSAIRLAGALLIEQNDEWLVSRRYLSEESLALLSDEHRDPDEEEVAELQAV